MVVVTLNELAKIRTLTKKLNELAENIVEEEDFDNIVTFRFQVGIIFIKLRKLMDKLPTKENWYK